MPFDPSQPSYFLTPSHHPITEGSKPLHDPGTLEQVGVYGLPGPDTIDAVL